MAKALMAERRDFAPAGVATKGTTTPTQSVTRAVHAPPPTILLPPPCDVDLALAQSSIIHALRHGRLGVIVGREAHGPPPAKRRKLASRDTPANQSTLDSHFFAGGVTAVPPLARGVVTAVPHDQPAAASHNGPELATQAAAPAQTVAEQIAVVRQHIPHLTTSVGAAQQDKKTDKRTLRSQDDGPRLKSELAVYFPNYEDVIFDTAPQETDLLTVDTTFYIVDEGLGKADPSPSKSTKTAKATSSANGRRSTADGLTLPTTPHKTASSQFNGSPTLNLDIVAKNIPDNPVDPLSDEHFLKAHRRAERREKQLRNIEREHAMHEKVQLDRLLDGLQGHDWLRVLGITGITDGESKKYELKRDYFINEVKALLDKFVQWREQEKKQRLDKEAAIAAQIAGSDEDEDEDGEEDVDEDDDGDISSSEINASAARQLQQETLMALRNSVTAKASRKSKAPRSSTTASSSASTPVRAKAPPLARALPPAEPDLPPITSFYAKRHLRDAALGKARHGRNVTAFGLPLPDMPERDFTLPAEYVTEETLRANARERRRRKRETVANAASGT